MEAFFGKVDIGSRIIEREAALIPKLTLRTSLKQSIDKSNKGLYRYCTSWALFCEKTPLCYIMASAACSSAIFCRKPDGFSCVGVPQLLLQQNSPIC